MYFTYILYSPKTNKFYIGSTNNLERRLLEHNSNKTTSLKNKGPFRLVYKEVYSDSISAKKREFLIKSYKGGNAFTKLSKNFQW